MLEFEDNSTQERPKVEATMPDGFVMLPISEYNKLLLAANKPWPMQLKLSSWVVGKNLAVEFDGRAIYRWALEQLKQQYTGEELADLRIRPFNDVFVCDMTIAETKRDVDAGNNKEPAPF